MFLNWLSGALVGVGGSDFIGYQAPHLEGRGQDLGRAAGVPRQEIKGPW